MVTRCCCNSLATGSPVTLVTLCMPKQKLSLRYELATLRDAIEAARVLTTQLGDMQFANVADEKRAPHGVSAILILVEDRIKNIARAMGGQVDPSFLIARHNEFPDDDNDDDSDDATDDDPDVYLSAWSLDKQATDAHALLRRAEQDRHKNSEK